MQPPRALYENVGTQRKGVVRKKNEKEASGIKKKKKPSEIKKKDRDNFVVNKIHTISLCMYVVY